MMRRTGAEPATNSDRRLRSARTVSRCSSVVLAAVALAGCTAAKPPAVSTPGVLRGRLSDLAAVTHVIATGRRISPIGRLGSTANFPSAVLVSQGAAYVLADGATHTQSVARYDAATLAAQGSVLGFRGPVKKSGPRGKKAFESVKVRNTEVYNKKEMGI
jgi:hypothetical protein